MTGKDFIPPEANIIRIARAVQEAEGSLWDFAEEYHVLAALPDFNYRALARAVKDQHKVDLYPPHTATKLRKAYETFVIKCRVPMDRIRDYSPYYLYSVSCMTDITPQNVEQWLVRVRETPRDDLLDQIRAQDDTAHEPVSMLRVPENVYQDMMEACLHLGQSVGAPDMTITVYLEFTSELIKNTKGQQLRRLWDVMHGLAGDEAEAA